MPAHRCRAEAGLPEVTVLDDPPGVALTWTCLDPACARRGARYFMADDPPPPLLEWD